MEHIKLTQGKFALVDNADFEWLNQWKWCAVKGRNGYYAGRADTAVNPNQFVLMHRQILGLEKGDGKKTDHRNGDGLDNHRTNLRACTTAENQRNRGKQINCTSGFKGVVASGKRWRAYLRYNKKHIHLGCFTTQIEAAYAYDNAAIKYFGEFAKLNFPPSHPSGASDSASEGFSMKGIEL